MVQIDGSFSINVPAISSVVPESLPLYSSHSLLYSLNMNYTIVSLKLIVGTPFEKQEPSPISQIIRCLLPEICIRKEILTFFCIPMANYIYLYLFFQQRSIFVFSSHNIAAPLSLRDELQKLFRQKLENAP